MKLEIYEDSKNYTCQIIKLPVIQEVKGLDNLVKVTHQGNDCLIGKDSDPNGLYLFFPAECKIDARFLSSNNLYRHSELNEDKNQKGFFEDNGRVRSVKFKGVISTGFIIPIYSLLYSDNITDKYDVQNLKIGDEFNSLNGQNVCSKYYKKQPGTPQAKRERKVNDFIDGRMAPQHFDTSHLLKNCDKLSLDDYIAVTYKLHGTSARYYNTLVKRKLSLLERFCKFIGVKVQTEDYCDVAASRRVVLSIDYETLPNKNHYYGHDIHSKVGKDHFQGKLNKGEAVYCEIIGLDTVKNKAVQHGYSYGLNKEEVYIYRISNINSQGIEVDLSYLQMKERAIQLGIKVCPELFYGTLYQFMDIDPNTSGDPYVGLEQSISDKFYKELLEKPSILDNSVIEEGFCIRIDKYPKPEIYKIKSKLFLQHETKMADKEIVDIESEQN